jgi:tetratricopeptide (TPR) repeat protein
MLEPLLFYHGSRSSEPSGGQKMRATLLCGVGAAVCGWLQAGSALAIDAAEVFKSAGPSVVLIKDAEGFGSGVVLSSDGLILTCYHVVNTPLKQTVVAEVTRAGQRSKQEFTDLKIEGVHPKYDLALVRIRLPSGTAMVPPQKSARRTLDTGEECFVIGNPSGAAGKALENSISKGIVSSAERAIDDLRYIQVTAQINPGNSGGALCDRNGHLAGIVTFKIDQAEGLGFAIPIGGMKTADFIAPKERKGNLEQYTKYEKAGTKWFDIARRVSGDRRDAALYLAYVCFRLSLAELPNESAPYHNVGLMYYEMKEHDSAKAFFEKAVELDNDRPTTRQMLGMVYVAQKQTDVGDKHFVAGIQTKRTDPDSVRAQSACCENYSVSMIERGRNAESAYLVKWADSLSTDPARTANRQKLFQNSVQQLSDAQFTEISGKTAGFSLDDMKRFASGKAAAGAKPVQVAMATPPEAASPSGATAATVGKLFDKMLEGAPKPGAGGIRKALPEAPVDARPALGGAMLVMHFPSMGKLGVFNIAQAKFDTYLPAPADVVYAAGGVNMLLYLPKDRVFQIWDMRTCERAASKPSRIMGELTVIEMALLNSQSAIISYADSTDTLATRHYAVLDLTSFQTVEIVDQNFCRNGCYRDNVHVRLDDGFTSAVAWCTSHGPTGFIFGRVSPRGVTDGVYQHSGFGSLTLDRTGTRVFSSMGSILSPKGESRKQVPGTSFFAVRGGDFFLEVRKNKVIVRDSVTELEVTSFDLPFDFATRPWTKDHLTDDRLVHASAQLNRACFIEPTAPAAYVFDLGLGANAQQIRQSLEGVKRGSLWTRKMGFPAGTRVNVEDGPQGVKYEASTGTLSWNIPASQPAGNVTLLLSVTMPGKDEAYQRVVVPVQ